MQAMEYRRDIDGLRAVAIGAVVLAHADIPPFSGGFVGVDVFFVISGFLITTLVMARIEAGTFSLVDFFERRASRLLPALAAMLLTVAAVGCLILTPRELAMLGQDLTATALFAMNVQGWSTGGYFGEEAATRVLLHAWSLAVEEQFYLLFPAALWSAWWALQPWGTRTARLLIVAGVAAMIAVSLWLQQVLVNWPTSAAFYLLPPRMWELGIGALLALLVQQGWVRSARTSLASAAAMTALALIAWPVATYGKHTVFPGLAAVPPVLGAAVLIWAGTAAPGNPISRLLSTRAMVGLGLISYSLYLWHWPILAFARLWNGRPLTLSESAVLIAISLALAAASWRVIEQPLRRRGPDASIKARLAFALLVLVPVVAIGQVYHRTGGLPDRVDDAVLRTDAEGRPSAELADCTQIRSGDCRFAAQGRRQGTIVLWGDSHAGHFAPAVAQAMTQHGYEVVLASARSCPPLPRVRLSILLDGGPIGQSCMEFNDAMPQRLAAIKDLKLVILAGRWTSFLSPEWKDAEDRWLELPDGARANARQSDTLMQSGIERAVTPLSEREIPVVVFDQVGEFVVSPRNCVARARMFGRGAGSCTDSEDITSAERARLHQLMARAQQAQPNVRIFHAEELMCTAGRCDPAPFGQLLYRDAHHLSVAGARRYVPLVEQLLLQELRAAR